MRSEVGRVVVLRTKFAAFQNQENAGRWKGAHFRLVRYRLFENGEANMGQNVQENGVRDNGFCTTYEVKQQFDIHPRIPTREGALAHRFSISQVWFLFVGLSADGRMSNGVCALERGERRDLDEQEGWRSSYMDGGSILLAFVAVFVSPAAEAKAEVFQSFNCFPPAAPVVRNFLHTK